eukprot:6993894-Pyramimonas_sp.AAC.1
MSTLLKDDSKHSMAGMSPGKLRWSGEPELLQSGYTRERADFPGPGAHETKSSMSPGCPTKMTLKGSEARFYDIEPSEGWLAWHSVPGPGNYEKPAPPALQTAVTLNPANSVPRIPLVPMIYQHLPGPGAYRVDHDAPYNDAPHTMLQQVSFDKAKRQVCTPVEELRDAARLDPGPGSYHVEASYAEVRRGITSLTAPKGC